MDFHNLDWNKALDRLAERSWICLDNFLSLGELEALLAEFEAHREQEDLRRAGIGKSFHYQREEEIRGDYIVWIDPQHSAPASLAFIQRMKAFMLDLNKVLYLSMKDIESHFALYPPGTFYQRHIDQFKNSGHRILSFACYLNRDWAEGDGGELEILDGKETHQLAPISGRLVLFRSDLIEHAVLETKKDRISVTGWMLDRPIDHPIH